MKRDVVVFVAALMFMSSLYGYLISSRQWFPYESIQAAKQGYQRVSETLGWSLPWYYTKTRRMQRAASPEPESIAPGLTLVSGIGAGSQIEARVVDSAGEAIHRWSLNWFDLWPDATHIDARFKPVSPPGTHVHGIMLMDNGDLVFNLERTGLYRVDACGRIVWKLPRMTHHSVYRDDEGNFWVPDLEIVSEPRADLPGYVLPFMDYKILKVSDGGEVLAEWSVIDLLKANGLDGLLYMATDDMGTRAVNWDSLHVNDIEIFPESLPRGVFKPGDVMVSLRNVHAILVFDRNMKTVKHVFTGAFLRQHDPDFVDGNSIVIFDNYPPGVGGLPKSRILRMSVDRPGTEIVFEGSEKLPFFTKIMGKQQLLGNGNRLLTEATSGRAIEISPRNELVWEYVNVVEDGRVGMIDEAQRLPGRFDKSFFRERRRLCNA